MTEKKTSPQCISVMERTKEIKKNGEVFYKVIPVSGKSGRERLQEDFAANGDDWEICVAIITSGGMILQKCGILTEVFRSIAHEHSNLQEENKMLLLQKKNSGGQSYKIYKQIHALARRYYRMKLRHNPDFLRGQAATAVLKHCRSKAKRFPSRFPNPLPAHKTIKNQLKSCDEDLKSLAT